MKARVTRDGPEPRQGPAAAGSGGDEVANQGRAGVGIGGPTQAGVTPAAAPPRRNAPIPPQEQSDSALARPPAHRQISPDMGSRHRAGAGFTFSGTEREHQAARGSAGVLMRKGLNPSGSRLASVPQRCQAK
jgi:hypothetical protein